MGQGGGEYVFWSKQHVPANLHTLADSLELD